MNKLPQREKAYIPIEKIENYLLSETHSVGQSKAKFFRIFGYNETNLEKLTNDLLAIAHTEDIKKSVTTVHGNKHLINGTLLTPCGRIVKVQTIWIIEKTHPPRFVTAYPLK